MQFSIDEPRTMTLRNFQPRSEHHGQDLVPAFSMHLKMVAAFGILDSLDPELRPMLWDGSKARDHKLQGPFKLKDIELVGWQLIVRRATSDITIDGCTVTGFIIEPKDDGIVQMLLKVNGTCDDPMTRGTLDGLIGHEVDVALIAPQADMIGDGKTATDLFVAGSDGGEPAAATS